MRFRLSTATGVAGSLGAAARSRAPGPLTRGPGWSTCSPSGAWVYEASLDRVLTGLYRTMAADLRRATAGSPPDRVVDVGAGPGGLVVALARAFPEARITAVDLDPKLAARARTRMVREGLVHRVEVVVGDVTALPLPDGSADLVTSSFSVHHWPEAAEGFTEVRRVLRPGGLARIYDVPDWWGRVETGAPPLASVARQADAAFHIDGLAWPGPVRLVRRMDLSR